MTEKGPTWGKIFDGHVFVFDGPYLGVLKSMAKVGVNAVSLPLRKYNLRSQRLTCVKKKKTLFYTRLKETA